MNFHQNYITYNTLNLTIINHIYYITLFPPYSEFNCWLFNCWTNILPFFDYWLYNNLCFLCQSLSMTVQKKTKTKKQSVWVSPTPFYFHLIVTFSLNFLIKMIYIHKCMCIKFLYSNFVTMTWNKILLPCMKISRLLWTL